MFRTRGNRYGHIVLRGGNGRPNYDSVSIALVEKAYGRPLDAVFESFDREPVASASIAQVHFAVLPGGREVAVKVLRPGMLRAIEDDLALLRTAAGWVERNSVDGRRLRPREVVAEFDKYLHDELDLAPFKVKVKVGGGAAGHNGLRSIDRHLGPDYRRVRLGIGHPGHKDRVHGYVLGNYARQEMDGLAAMLGAVSAEAEWLARGDDPRFMSEYALRMQDAM